MNPHILSQLQAYKTDGRKRLAMLLDPDKTSLEAAEQIALKLESAPVDLLLVGGSLLQDTHIRQLVPYLKSLTKIPVILFPGSPQQVVSAADAILLLSLISGRNPDLLIGRHVEAAPLLKRSGLEILPTGYMLIDCGKLTTAHYMSHTLPIPYDKPDIAACTALAGEMLGLKLIYLDGGSGAQKPISAEMIETVAQTVQLPLFVGGGIRSAQMATTAWQAGADIIVIGNALEKDQEGNLLSSLIEARESFSERV